MLSKKIIYKYNCMCLKKNQKENHLMIKNWRTKLKKGIEICIYVVHILVALLFLSFAFNPNYSNFRDFSCGIATALIGNMFIIFIMKLHTK